MKSRCYLCLQKTKFKDSLLCMNCYCQLQDYRWISCARCGDSYCSGCHALSSFVGVHSLYMYKNTMADILVMSKENKNKSMQNVFNELFFVPFKNQLLEMIMKEKFDYIILSPLRRERIFSSSWHPNLFFDEVLDYLFKNELLTKQKPEILTPLYDKKKKKQSWIPTLKRAELNKNKDKQKLIFHNQSEIKLSENKNILFIDDVLTTGKTALLCQSLCEKYFLNCSWSLVTLFRAPVSKK